MRSVLALSAVVLVVGVVAWLWHAPGVEEVATSATPVVTHPVAARIEPSAPLPTPPTPAAREPARDTPGEPSPSPSPSPASTANTDPNPKKLDPIAAERTHIDAEKARLETARARNAMIKKLDVFARSSALTDDQTTTLRTMLEAELADLTAAHEGGADPVAIRRHTDENAAAVLTDAQRSGWTVFRARLDEP